MSFFFWKMSEKVQNSETKKVEIKETTHISTTWTSTKTGVGQSAPKASTKLIGGKKVLFKSV